MRLIPSIYFVEGLNFLSPLHVSETTYCTLALE